MLNIFSRRISALRPLQVRCFAAEATAKATAAAAPKGEGVTEEKKFDYGKMDYY